MYVCPCTRGRAHVQGWQYLRLHDATYQGNCDVRHHMSKSTCTPPHATHSCCASVCKDNRMSSQHLCQCWCVVVCRATAPRVRSCQRRSWWTAPCAEQHGLGRCGSCGSAGALCCSTFLGHSGKTCVRTKEWSGCASHRGCPRRCRWRCACCRGREGHCWHCLRAHGARGFSDPDDGVTPEFCFRHCPCQLPRAERKPDHRRCLASDGHGYDPRGAQPEVGWVDKRKPIQTAKAPSRGHVRLFGTAPLEGLRWGRH